MKFEWDAKKAENNFHKHGVSFDEAKEVFFDEYGLDEYDEFHSSIEDRFIRIGMGLKNVLFVVYMVKDEQSETYRLISARGADKTYETTYWEERRKRGG